MSTPLDNNPIDINKTTSPRILQPAEPPAIHDANPLAGPNSVNSPVIRTAEAIIQAVAPVEEYLAAQRAQRPSQDFDADSIIQTLTAMLSQGADAMRSEGSEAPTFFSIRMGTKDRALLDLAMSQIDESNWDELKNTLDALELEGTSTTDLYALKALWYFVKRQNDAGEDWLNKFLNSKPESRFLFPEKLIVYLHAIREVNPTAAIRCAKRLVVFKKLSDESRYHILKSYGSLLLDSYFTNSMPLMVEFKKKEVQCGTDPEQIEHLKMAKEIFHKASKIKNDESVMIALVLTRVLLNDPDSDNVLKSVKATRPETVFQFYVACVLRYVFNGEYSRALDWIHEVYMNSANITSSLRHDSDKRSLFYTCVVEIIKLRTDLIFGISQLNSKIANSQLELDLEKILIFMPERADYYRLFMARTLQNLGKDDKAYDQYLQFHKTQPHNPSRMLLLADAAPQADKVDEALQIMSTFLATPESSKADQNDVNCLLIKWTDMIITHRKDTCLAEIEKTLIPLYPKWSPKRQSTFLETLRKHGILYRSVLEKLCSTFKEDHLLRLKLGECYFVDKNYQGAIAELEKIPLPVKILDDENSAKYYLYMTRSYFTLNKFVLGFKYFLGTHLSLHQKNLCQETNQILMTFNSTERNKLYEQMFFAGLDAIRTFSKNKEHRQTLIYNFIACIKELGMVDWLDAKEKENPEFAETFRCHFNAKEFQQFTKQLGLKKPKAEPIATPAPQAAPPAITPKESKVSETPTATSTPPSKPPSAVTDPNEILLRHAREEEQRRVEAAEEKARLRKLRKESMPGKQEKKHPTKAAVLPVQSQPFKLPEDTSDFPPNYKIVPKFNVEYLEKKYIPTMLRCSEDLIAGTEKPKAPTARVPAPVAAAPRPIESVPLKDLKPYVKPPIDEKMPYLKKPAKPKEATNAIVPVDNPDVNRVKSASRYVSEMKALLDKFEISYPQTMPRNKYFVNRALMYYLMRFGESLSSTSDEGELSPEAYNEIHQRIMNLELAHHLRNGPRNWFQCLTPDKVLRTCRELTAHPIEKALNEWVASKDKKIKMPNTPLPGGNALNILLQPLTTKEERDKWLAMKPDERCKIYLKIIFEELEQLELFPDVDKMTLTHFCVHAHTERAAVKMSCSIIDKCLDALLLEIDPSLRKKISTMSNVIGHSVGEYEQARHYKYEEIPSDVLYKFARNAKELKRQINVLLNNK